MERNALQHSGNGQGGTSAKQNWPEKCVAGRKRSQFSKDGSGLPPPEICVQEGFAEGSRSKELVEEPGSKPSSSDPANSSQISLHETSYGTLENAWPDRTIYHHDGTPILADLTKAMVDVIFLCFSGSGYLP